MFWFLHVDWNVPIPPPRLVHFVSMVTVACVRLVPACWLWWCAVVGEEEFEPECDDRWADRGRWWARAALPCCFWLDGESHSPRGQPIRRKLWVDCFSLRLVCAILIQSSMRWGLPCYSPRKWHWRISDLIVFVEEAVRCGFFHFLNEWMHLLYAL